MATLENLIKTALDETLNADEQAAILSARIRQQYLLIPRDCLADLVDFVTFLNRQHPKTADKFGLSKHSHVRDND